MNVTKISNDIRKRIMSKDSRLRKPEKMVMIMILMDIVEIYSMEALEGTRHELKRIVKQAIQTNKAMTKLASKYLSIAEDHTDGDITEDFCEAAEFIQSLIEEYFHGNFIDDGDGYIKIKKTD